MVYIVYGNYLVFQVDTQPRFWSFWDDSWWNVGLNRGLGMISSWICGSKKKWVMACWLQNGWLMEYFPWSLLWMCHFHQGGQLRKHLFFFGKLDERSHSICHNNFITTSQFIGADLLRVVKRMPPEEVGVLSTVCREPVVLPRKKRGLLKQRL